MQAYCHRCGEELPPVSGESTFCPHCGAPQLRLALENQSPETNGEAPETSTAAPPPRPNQIDWATAIRYAALVAVIGAALSVASVRLAVLSPVSLLWVMSASLITMSLYQKRLPKAWMDIGVGARIGLVVGLCLALALGSGFACWGLVERFALHATANFDAQMTAQMVQAQRAIEQKAAAQSTPVSAQTLKFLMSPEFRAGIMLATFAMGSGFLLLLSTLGGAFAGILRMRRSSAA